MIQGHIVVFYTFWDLDDIFKLFRYFKRTHLNRQQFDKRECSRYYLKLVDSPIVRHPIFCLSFQFEIEFFGLLSLLIRSKNQSSWVLVTFMNLVLKMTHKHCGDTRKLLENLDFNENLPFSGQKVTHKHCGTFIKISSKLPHSNFSSLEIQTFWWIFDLFEIFGPFREFSDFLTMYELSI